MTWTPQSWEGFALLLEEWWKDELPDQTREAWKLALDDVEPGLAVATLKGMLRRGGTWRPSTAEFIAALEERQAGSVPSFDEAWPVVYRAMSGFNPYDELSPARVVEHVRVRAGDVAAGWVAAISPARLAAEPVDDPQYGGAVLNRLRAHYTQIASTPGGRDRLALALNEPARRGELRRFDPAGLIAAPANSEVDPA